MLVLMITLLILICTAIVLLLIKANLQVRLQSIDGAEGIATEDEVVPEGSSRRSVARSAARAQDAGRKSGSSPEDSVR